MAHAAIWLPRGRLAKYASASASSNRSTLPVTRTWRCSGSQPKSSAARGLAASSSAFSLAWFV